MKKIFLALGLVTAFAVLSCTKGGTLVGLNGNTYTMNSPLNGANVVPATANDTSKGTFAGWYDEGPQGGGHPDFRQLPLDRRDRHQKHHPLTPQRPPV
jgi:hypothetical protein